MTSGSAGFGKGVFAAELTQLRNADIPEALGIFMAQVKTFRRRLAAIPGFRAHRIGVLLSSIPWSAISGIVSDDRNLMIHLSPLNAIFLPKAAFENQDVDGFCAELRRRWTEANS